MFRQLLRISCMAALVSTLGLAGCKKRVNGVIVVGPGKAKTIWAKPGEKDPMEEGLPERDWVVLCRKDSKFGPGEDCKAGEAYLIDENLNWKKIGAFDAGKSDEELAKEYR